MTQWGLDTLFNPAKRHMDEEKRRLQSTREEVGDSSGGKRIDLESGKVQIHRDVPADNGDTDPDAAADTNPAPAVIEESDARARARERRRAAKSGGKPGGKPASGERPEVAGDETEAANDEAPTDDAPEAEPGA